MAAFDVADADRDRAGEALAQRPEVSHCYHRPPLADFPYTLYAMTHGQSQSEVTTLVAQLAADLAIQNYALLFSQIEYKKTSMKYFTEPATP